MKASWRLALAAGGALALAPARAGAHEFRPAVLVLEEGPEGEVSVRLEVSSEPGADAPAVTLPPHCGAVRGGRARCGPAGLRGELKIAGLVRGELVLRVLGPAGEETRVIEPGTEAVALGGPERAPPGFFALGLAHIVGGADHLLFVAGLALLVRPALRLAAALTAFTAAHGLTLALTAVGALHLPQAPVEAAIALSLVLLGRALARGERPRAGAAWRLAGACGLLHGLGFAGALAEVGLPPEARAAALLAFHAGVEAGQLAAAAAVAAALWRVRAAWVPVAAGYALGSLAAAWTVARVLAFFDRSAWT